MSLENKNSKNDTRQEKSGRNLEDGLTKSKLREKLEDFSRKKGMYVLGALATFMVASNPAKSQTLEKQTYNTTLADGTHANLTERQLLETAAKNNQKLYINGKYIDAKSALQKLNNFENNQQIQNKNNSNNFQNNQERRPRTDTSIERGVSNIDKTMDQFGDAFILDNFSYTAQKSFQNYEQMETFMADRRNNFDPNRISLMKNGQEIKLINLEYFKNHKQDIINNYINNYLRVNNSNNQNQINQNPNNPYQNSPQNNQEGGQENQGAINYNYYFQRIPMGKGEILNYNEDGSATIFSSSKSYKTLTLKKLSNQSQVLNPNHRNSLIDINKLFDNIQKSIPLGKTGKIIQDNGNGTATEYKVFINKRGDEIHFTLEKMIRVF